MVRALALSDIHGNWRGLREVLTTEDYDVAFVVGDLSDYSGSADRVVDTLAKHLKSVAFVVIGNMDSPRLIEDLRGHEVLRVLHGEVARYLAYSVVGFSGGLTSPFNTAFEMSEEGFAELVGRVSTPLAGQGNLIVITHTPPYGTRVDLTHSGLHVGSKVLRDFIASRRPVVTICGHIHEGRGYDYVGATPVINPGPLLRGYYAVVRLGDAVGFELRSLSGK